MSVWDIHVPLSPVKRRLLGVAAFFVVLVSWTGLCLSGLISPNKLPAPWEVLNAFSYLAYHEGKSLLLTATLWSTTRIAMSSLLVVVIGIPIGIAMGASPKINAVLSPLVDPFRSAPVVALLPILVMWLGIGEEMKISFLFLGGVVYMIPMVRDAIVAVPYTYWENVCDLGGTKWECIWRGVVPLAMPRIADAIIVATSVMWTYITVAEYVNADSGLGQMIQNSKRFSANDQVFAGIITIIILALITYQAMLWAKRKIYHWETQQ